MKTLHEAAPEPLTSDQEKALSAEAKTGPFQHATPSYGNDTQSGETPRLSSNRHAGSTPPAAPASQWMPIETAPKDVTILLYGAKRLEMCVGMHHSRDGWVTDTTSEWMSMYPPTHWMPLPAAPAPAMPDLKHCACEFDGDTCVTQCKLHAAHVDAIHEWAERAKAAEDKLSAAPAAPVVPLTKEQLAKIAVEDELLLYCDQDSFNEIARAIELAHGITGASK